MRVAGPRRRYLGTSFPGAAMSYAQLEALRFLAACFGVGAAIGLIRGIVVELRRS